VTGGMEACQKLSICLPWHLHGLGGGSGEAERGSAGDPRCLLLTAPRSRRASMAPTRHTTREVESEILEESIPIR